ncbi:uncharacterized protein PSFLO_07246 [Pseudozyma flocculosa]|uniref:Uncharacterized protein n=1 Tax=Pseudozyma flocculosa TaxID=84751 RepID=A0A5C3FBD2_9BASI|nr:uncharacterized protein PSFLO_07246 [Pseudozyma flocculosa]
MRFSKLFDWTTASDGLPFPNTSPTPSTPDFVIGLGDPFREAFNADLVVPGAFVPSTPPTLDRRSSADEAPSDTRSPLPGPSTAPAVGSGAPIGRDATVDTCIDPPNPRPRLLSAAALLWVTTPPIDPPNPSAAPAVGSGAPMGHDATGDTSIDPPNPSAAPAPDRRSLVQQGGAHRDGPNDANSNAAGGTAIPSASTRGTRRQRDDEDEEDQRPAQRRRIGDRPQLTEITNELHDLRATFHRMQDRVVVVEDRVDRVEGRTDQLETQVEEQASAVVVNSRAVMLLTERFFNVRIDPSGAMIPLTPGAGVSFNVPVAARAAAPVAIPAGAPAPDSVAGPSNRRRRSRLRARNQLIPLGEQVCWLFQSGDCQGCERLHECNKCSGNHPGGRCGR